jgi:hypothetical protein
MIELYRKGSHGMIPPSAWLVMGDLPEGSQDSTRFGFIMRADILGRAERPAAPVRQPSASEIASLTTAATAFRDRPSVFFPLPAANCSAIIRCIHQYRNPRDGLSPPASAGAGSRPRPCGASWRSWSSGRNAGAFREEHHA